jgi:pimeloyl-ACP methyl ester carboxylesterase
MQKRNGSYLKSFDGTKIYYEVRGDGKRKNCLVLLHGLGGDLTAWDKEVEYFNSEGLSTIAIDLRGHGLSGRSKKSEFYKFTNFARDVVEVMKKEGFKKYSLIGRCFGGMVSLFLEAKYPKSSNNLILVDTSYKPPRFVEPVVRNPYLFKIFRLITKIVPDLRLKGHVNFDNFIGTNDIDLRRIISDVLHVSLKSYLLISENLVGYNAIDLLDKISVPTLVIEGKEDTIFPPEIAEKLKERIENSEIGYIDKANHILVINNPLDLAREIERFLIKQKFISN